MKIVALTLLLLLAACTFDTTYTLYRNSVPDNNMRVHVATFDADGEESYNKGNCEIAQELFQKQNGVKTKFWCEKGKYKS